MTMTLPTLPSLPAGYVVQAADLNNLAYCCTFVLTKPVTRVVDSAGGQSITGTAAPINFATASYDTDGMWSSGNPGRLTVQTNGWYKIRYSIAVQTSTSAFNTYARCQTGPNNPQGSGVISADFWPAYCNPLANTPGGAARSSGIIPFFLYAGDFVQVLAVGSNTTQAGDSEFSLEYVSLF